MATREDIEQNRREIFKKLRQTGRAVARVNANNTHSGNFSMRDPFDSDLFHITAGGSQGGDLIERDIVPIRFSGVSWGDARASSESTIHRKVLSLPGAHAVVHAHYLNSTFISFDTREKQLFLQFKGWDSKGREEFVFHPIDLFGAFLVGEVTVAGYDQPVGSAEMDERIPAYLSKNRLTIVRGHGPFARGDSIEDALFRLSVLENSATLLLHLRRRGVDVGGIQRKIRQKGIKSVFPAVPHVLSRTKEFDLEIKDPSIIEDFRQRLNYNYNNAIGAYGTGSMSQRISPDMMIYCPMSAAPEDFDFPLSYKEISFRGEDPCDLRLHKLIYENTHQNTVMITTSPMATAEGMAVLSHQYGMGSLTGDPGDITYTAGNHPVLVPIDGEAIYLNPKVGLADLSQLGGMTPKNPILNMLRWYKGCCIVAGYGVISTGETTLEQAAHNASSAERIARFRMEVFINEKMLDGPAVEQFEPER